MSILSCKPAQFIPGDSKNNFIRFGNGGGFTGAVKAWYLTESGALYEDNGEKPSYIGMAKKEIAKQMFAIPEIIHAKDNPYNVPGNRYFFIEYQIDGFTQKITWGGDQNHLKAYDTWYHNLMHLVKDPNLHRPESVQ